MKKEMILLGWNFIILGMMISGPYFIVLFFEEDTIATAFRKAMIPTIISVAIAICIWLIVFITSQTAKHKVAKLKKELEQRSLERNEIADKMDSLLRKLHNGLW